MQTHLFWYRLLGRLGAVAMVIGLLLAGTRVPGAQAAAKDKNISPHPPLLPETVSAGGSHTCGIKSDGTLACWGNNASGQSIPPAGTFTQVSAGGNHTCGLRTDGTLACWGSSVSGQSAPPGGIFTQVSAGANHTCAVKSDGTIACWGSDSSGQSTAPTGIFTQVSAGELHTCGLKNDASLVCWGSNVYGQSTPSIGSYLQVEAGGYHTCGVKSDGNMACWGDNRNGQTSSPVGTFTQVSGGYWHSCALQSSGATVCWGDNRNGQASPPIVFSGSYLQVSAGRYHTCAVRDDGTLNCWGRNTSGQAPVLMISPTSLPFGEVGILYSQLIGGGSGTAPYVFSKVVGSMPPGLALTGGGSISGTPTLGGLYTFAVQVTDASPIPFSTQRQYELTVIINTPPEADDDTFTVSEDSANNPLDVLTGDTDLDDDSLTVFSVTDPPHGAVTDNNSNVLYTPDPGYVGTDSFSYTVSDGMGGSDTATVTVTVINVNDAPVADDDTFTVIEDTSSNNLDVLNGDIDAENDPLTITSVTDPPRGTVVNNTSYVFYTPDLNYYGTDTFYYTVSDGNGGTDTAKVTVTVTNVNDPPSADDDSFTVNEDSVNNFLAVLVGDADPEGNPLVVDSVSDPPHGTAVDNNSNVLYTPDANFSGTDTFTYSITDYRSGYASATVTVTVRNINDPPVADDDTFTVDEDSHDQILDVLEGDTDLDGNPLQVALISDPPHGVAVDNNSNILYTPDADFNGTDSFTYNVSDGQGGSDTAIVTVLVRPVNDAPVADNDIYIVNENSLNNALAVLVGDSDPDGDVLVVDTVSEPAHGTSVDDNNQVLYTPDLNYSGSDNFTYTISDGNGGTASATVTITVTNGNDFPLADDDTFTVNEDSTNNPLDVLNGDTDLDGDPLNVSAVSDPPNGSAVDNNSNVFYTPDPNFIGIDTFTYTISDSNGGTDTATVTVTVNNVNNDAPSAVADDFDVDEDSNGNPLDVLLNDSDPDGDELVVFSVSDPPHGVATDSDNNIYYTPAPNFVGEDSFTYTVSDGNGSFDTTTVTVMVSNSNNDAPVADDDTFVLVEDSGVISLDVLSGDIDLDGDSLTVYSVTSPEYGTVQDGNSAVLYTPDVNYHGTDIFTYTVTDGQGGFDTATVTLTVTPVNDAPQAVDDNFTVGDYPSQSQLDTLANDNDPDGDVLQISEVSDPANGTATTDGNQVLYTPYSGFVGLDIFTYSVVDYLGVADTSIITVTVTSENNPPQADDDAFTLAEDSAATNLDVLEGDTDPESDSLSIVAVSEPQHGSATNDGNLVYYTPDRNFYGEDSFTYTITDGNGSEASATVTVTVMPVNDAPSADDDNFTVFADSADNVLDVLSGDTDLDGDVLTITGMSVSAHGVVSLTEGSLLYTPQPGYTGVDTFTYTVADGQGGEASASVIITVTDERHCVYLPFAMRIGQKSGPVYQEDFEDGAGSEWSLAQIGNAPNGQRFLGQFGAQSVSLSLDGLYAHRKIRISFELYIIRSWDGNDPLHGPDFWGFGLAGETPLLYTTFSNWVDQNQAYPDNYPSGNYPAQSGTATVGALGYQFDQWQQDAVYRFDLVVDHSADNLDLAFFAEGLQVLQDESWGLDNIEINLLP